MPSITTTKIGSNHYALVASKNDNGVQIINITDPASPTAVADITRGTDYPELLGPNSITTTQIGPNHYALVASLGGNSVQIINITEPASPTAVADITDGSTYPELLGPISITTTQIGSNHYALVASFRDDGVQIINITEPARPTAVADITHGTDYPELDGAYSITTTQIGSNHYALVASENADGVQIIDITNPAKPSAVADVTDSTAANPTGYHELDGPNSITTTQIGSNHYALVASYYDSSVQIIDITDPAHPFNPLRPYVELDLAGDRRASYTGLEDDDKSMVFEYVVRGGDMTEDLAYKGTGAFNLGPNILKDAADSADIPSVTLPAPGNPNSLSHNKDIMVIENPPPTFVSSELAAETGVLTITFSETIDVTPAANVDAAKIHIRESGSSAVGVILTAGELVTATDANTISFNLTEQHLAAVARLTTPELKIDPGAVRDASGNLIVGTFDVSTAAFAHSFNVTSQDTVPTGMAFSNNGAKMFVVGNAGDAINEYDLDTPFDLSDVTFVHSFNVSAQDKFPTGMAFSNDGAKMFVVGGLGADINEYDLDTPFSVTPATFVDSFDVREQDTSPEGMAFSNDGAKMFVVGWNGNGISEYTLDTPFSVTSATYANVTFSVTNRDTLPYGMAFSNDGAKMFVAGIAGSSIYEYTLDTPFSVTAVEFVHSFNVTARDIDPVGMAFSNDGAKMFVVDHSGGAINEYTLNSVYPIRVSGNLPPADYTHPTFVSSGLDLSTRVLTITFSETIDATPATNVVAAKIRIRESGSSAVGVILTAGELVAATDANTISFNLTEQHLAAVARLTTPELKIDPGAVRDASGNLIVGTFDVSTAAFAHSFNVTSQDTAPTGMAFSNNGAKMFVVGNAGDAINEYDLDTPFDLSDVTFVHSFNVSAQDKFPTGMAFSNDGAKMFVVGGLGADINEYDLDTPFSVTPATFVDSFDVREQDTSPEGMAFSNDGAKMFVVGWNGNGISEYTLDTPFSVTSATYANVTFSVTDKDTLPYGMAFSNDGAKMFVAGIAGSSIYEYTLDTPFSVTAVEFVHSFNVTARDIDPVGMAFSNDGAKMFVVDHSGGAINEYTLNSVYPIGVSGNLPYISPAQVTSDKPDGDYGPGTEINVRLDFAEPVGLDIVPVADSQPVLQERFHKPATFQADGRHYAVLPIDNIRSSGDPDAVEIVDITDPDVLRVVARMENSTDFLLGEPVGVDMASIGGYQYAIVATFSEQLHIINVTDPENPSTEGMLLEVAEELSDFSKLYSGLVFQIGNYHYALVPAIIGIETAHFFSMVNITDPGNPSVVSVVPDNSGPFAGFNAFSPGSNLVQIGGHHYAVVPATSALVMLNITNPANLTYAGSARSGQGGFGQFSSGQSAVVEVDGHHYALIGSTGCRQ